MGNAVFVSVIMLAMSAAPSVAASKNQSTMPYASDQTFVLNAANGNMAEVELGKLAETRASSDQIKAFAKRMVDDHQKALDHLKMVATNEKITLPTMLDAKDQALKDRLEKLSGPAFDRAYMRAMITDHRHDVAEFRLASKDAKASDVKQYASTTLPTLEEHLKLAEQASKSVGAATTTSSR